MLRTSTRRWSNDLQTGLQPQSGMNFTRRGSMRLHGFQQQRALRRGGLRSVEMKYLKYAADGDIQVLERMLVKYTDEQLNRNCTDYFDRTALTLAITNHRDEVIQSLLKAGVDLTESLFYAIENEYTEAVEYILNSETAQRMRHGEMLITSEESIFPRFLSPIMLAAHKNNFEILEILYNHGHRLCDHSVSASNKWDEIRLKWLYYKARASQAYMILMYNKEKVDPLNEAIEFYGRLTREGLKSREVRENYKQLAFQCEDFAIALLNQLRTAKELADLLRFTLVGREHGNTHQLALSTIPVLMRSTVSDNSINVPSTYSNPPVKEDVDDDEYHGAASHATPTIRVTESKNEAAVGRRAEPRSSPRSHGAGQQHDTAEWIRSVTNAQLSATPNTETLRRMIASNESPLGSMNSINPDQRRLSQAADAVPQERYRSLGIRRAKNTAVNQEYARPIHFLKPIEKAVDNGMVRLVTCENSQLALTYLKDGILFRNTSPSICLLKKFVVGLLFPIISTAFFLFPNSKLGLVARNPTAKLWMEVASDIFLIALLVLNLLLSEFHVIGPATFSPVLIVAYFWMPGKLINLTFLVYHQGRRVFYSIWNWNDIATIGLYTGFMILRIYGETMKSKDLSRGQWSPIPVSDMMISVVYILVFLRPLEILRVNRTFGPLQVSVDRMLKDVTKFFLIFLVIWFAFSSGINTLFWRYKGEPRGKNCSLANDTKMDYADGHCCFFDKDAQKFTDLGTSLQVHFWSIFGYSDDYNDWFNLTCPDDGNKYVTAKFGEVVFALYHVGTVLVLVNMLIAIMSGTLQKTIDDSDIQWQFHRTRVWIRFIRTGFYRPPPMNIFPRPKDICFLCKSMAKGFRALKRGTWRTNHRGSREHSENPEQAYEIRLSNFTRMADKNGQSGMLESSVSNSRLNGSVDSTSASVETQEERSTSGYDVALMKCVKRYLKTHAVQGDELSASNAAHFL